MNKNRTMLSIIIPTYNEEKYIGRLLDSIKKSKDIEYEIIVADANSKDRTREIAKSFGCKVVKGGKPAEGRNSGAEAAKGNLLFFLDADVILPKNFLEESISEFNKRQLDIAMCLFQPTPKKMIDKVIYELHNLYLVLTEKFNPTTIGHSILTKKSMFNKVNGFNETLKLSEDYDFGQRASKKGKYGVLKSKKLLVSTRRWEKEGRFKLLAIYLLSGIFYKLGLKIKGKIFDYQLGGEK